MMASSSSDHRYHPIRTNPTTNPFHLLAPLSPTDTHHHHQPQPKHHCPDCGTSLPTAHPLVQQQRAVTTTTTTMTSPTPSHHVHNHDGTTGTCTACARRTRATDLLLTVLAVLCPPGVAYIKTGMEDVWLNVALTLFGWVPGMLRTFCLILPTFLFFSFFLYFDDS